MSSLACFMCELRRGCTCGVGWFEALHVQYANCIHFLCRPEARVEDCGLQGLRVNSGEELRMKTEARVGVISTETWMAL